MPNQIGEFSVANFRIPRGDWGLPKKIRMISGLIEKGKRDPRIRKIAIDILRDVPEKTWEEEVNAIFDFIKSEVRYTRDIKGVETLQAPWTTYDLGAGDCDDQVILAGALLGCVGYPVKLATVVPRGKSEWGHIYLKVGLPPQAPCHWLSFDTTVNKPMGWEVPSRIVSRKKEFLAGQEVNLAMSGIFVEDGLIGLGDTVADFFGRVLEQKKRDPKFIEESVSSKNPFAEIVKRGRLMEEQERLATEAKEELKKVSAEEGALPFKMLSIGLPILFFILVGGYFVLRKP